MPASAASTTPVSKRARVGSVENAANDALESIIGEVAEVIIRVMLFLGWFAVEHCFADNVYCVGHLPQNRAPPK